ncbi:hypothetical protein HTSR_1125 [Halodesulfurarchaeum formicicum]|uniref:DUF7123 domain-containing protein n=1 Tax=Halodesulfurarchaeum formicicum TaxID=1873524 RepID=A0A1D8S4N4_9EURY|nr:MULTISPECIES: hypothetical protein [Halodesulfurarchaeum]AOW80305.1 hypothetical protein HTSR_1125 [Halodesulfurarchaeum formicicum]APE95608.1 hypothetical protein HSR6_1160 [Halodesulfurarchaeum formicicum]MDR5657106.1 hypothetical protein [Halodesulfurarchaeum sp. HSR-GB]
MSDFTEDEKRILSYLREKASRGQEYFRARSIADSLGLSSKQVGVRLARLGEKAEDVRIEKWGRSRSTTWRVERA